MLNNLDKRCKSDHRSISECCAISFSFRDHITDIMSEEKVVFEQAGVDSEGKEYGNLQDMWTEELRSDDWYKKAGECIFDHVDV